MWGSRKRNEQEPINAGPAEPPLIAKGTDPLAAAHDVAVALRAVKGRQQGGELDSIDVVHVMVGDDVGQDPQPGVQMLWRQGEGQFGLLTTIASLARAGGLESVVFYLRFAVDEPHGPAPDGSRKWFLDLPSAPY